jgi:hypothetical protein
MLFSPGFGAARAKMLWLENCVTGMNDELAAIMTKFVREHPERWHEPMHAQVYTALATTCQGSPLTSKK